MPLGGRPEPGLIAIGSHAAQRAPGLMCGALSNNKGKNEDEDGNEMGMEMKRNRNEMKCKQG